MERKKQNNQVVKKDKKYQVGYLSLKDGKWNTLFGCVSFKKKEQIKKKICWLLYSLLKANGGKSISAAFIILWISYA